MTHTATYPRFLLNPRYWREMHNAYLRADRTRRCTFCKGTGEIACMGDYGEYEQPDPCPKCRRATPRKADYDSAPF